MRVVVVAPSWPSVLAGRLTLDLLEYRSHAAPEWRGGGLSRRPPDAVTHGRGSQALHVLHDATRLLAFRVSYGRRAGSLSERISLRQL